MNISTPFDLWNVFVNELFGDVGFFIFGIMLITLYISLRTKMPFQVTILLFIIMLAVVFIESQILLIWVFIILFIGTLYYFTFGKLLQR